jgi:ferritin-like metal-binding protein YciE
MAQQLGHAEVVELLQATLDEEGAADKKLTSIAQKGVLPAAAAAEEAAVEAAE